MNETFKVGEVAIIQNIPSEKGYLNGTECVIISGIETHVVTDIDGVTGFATGYVAIDVDGPGVLYYPENLRKKSLPSDSKEWAESKVKELINPLVMA